jgi:hypothetical protein
MAILLHRYTSKSALVILVNDRIVLSSEWVNGHIVHKYDGFEDLADVDFISVSLNVKGRFTSS